MKLAKLSLAAMVVAGLATSSFAADTLADAFAKGKVSGELRAWYFDRDTTAGTKTGDADVFNTGLVLGYVTDSLYGFNIGATMQSSFAPFADKDAKAVFGTAGKDEYGSGAVLSEAYLGYKLKNTTVKIGRQFITTPLVAGSGSRMIKQSFEGATVVNTDLPQTTLFAGIVTKYQDRVTVKNGEASVGSFADLTANNDKAYTLLAINKSITGLTLTGQWAQLENAADWYYAEAAYAGKAASFSYGVAANYLLKAPDAGEDGTMYGVKADIGIDAFKAYVAYTKVTDDASVAGIGGAGLGGGAQPAFAKGYQLTTGTYDADTEAYSIDANYNFAQIGLLLGARYTGIEIGANTERSITDIYAVYNFAGALKGLSADVSYEDQGKDFNGQELWFKANYKF